MLDVIEVGVAEGMVGFGLSLHRLMVTHMS